MRFSVTPTSQNALFRYAAAREARGATPRQPAGHYGKRLNWANALEQPPASLRGGPQASAWGLTARKGAVWAEGLAESAPRARPGHHQAASCGLRRCRELGLREFVWVAASLPWRRGGRHRHAARRRSVHRSVEMAPRCRFGAFVYTVATREDRASDRGDSQECTQIGETGLSDPF